MVHISGAKTAREMWEQLKTVKEARGNQGILSARRTLYRTFADESTDIAVHIANFRNMQEELHLMGSLVSDSDFSILLLSSLPESWDQFTAAFMGSRDKTKEPLTSHKLIAILTEEYRRRKERMTAGGAIIHNTRCGVVS